MPETLLRIADRCRRVQLKTNATLRPREQRHCRRRERGQTDPDPAGAWVMAGDEIANRLDADVGGELEVAGGDQLLCAALR
jgi:hypothetical protein